MATVKQKKAALETLEVVRNGKSATKGEILRNADYSKNISEQPSRVLESKGYKEELAKYGLTEELISTALVDDIKAKPKKRLGELSLAADLLGMKQKTPNLTLNQVNIGEIKKEYE